MPRSSTEIPSSAPETSSSPSRRPPGSRSFAPRCSARRSRPRPELPRELFAGPERWGWQAGGSGGRPMADAASILVLEGMTASPDAAEARTAHRLAAFEELVLRHQSQIYRVAYRLAGNHDDAEDLAQEAIIEAFRAFDRYQPGTYFD